MNDFFQRKCEGDNQAVRQSLYEGTVYLLPATEASTQFVIDVWSELRAAFGELDPREAQFSLSSDEFFARAGQLRKLFYTTGLFHRHVCAVTQSVGFPPDEHAFDPVRLRTVTHDGHLNPSAQAVYHGHRDTWYSNPQSMITWWIPLHDVQPEETFEFFPDDFARSVANDSEGFDFDTWVADGQEKRIGWQNRLTGTTAQYPQLREAPQGRRIPVTCRAGDILLFSGQHLHQTRKNVTGLTRFSMDFRTVHLGDHNRGLEALNVDDRSTGSSLKQFISGVDHCEGV